MNPNWHRFLESAHAVFQDDTSELIHFGDASGELAAAGATVVVPLTHLGVIEASGEDSKGFLHGQLTSDVNHLTPGKAQLSAWCSAKGRMQASFIGWREEGAYLLALSADLQESIQKRMQMFVLRAKVKLVSRSDSHVLLGLAGPEAVAALHAAALPVPDEAMTTQAAEGCTVLRLDRQRLLLALPAEAAPALWTKLTTVARPAGLPVWRWLDIEQALPVISAATREEFVPQMADFEKMGGVSFHKGCYPGQEIVARTQYLGKVKRHLYRVRCQHALAAGDELHAPEASEQAAGRIVSAAPAPDGGYAALAVVQGNFAENLHLKTVDGPEVRAQAVNP